jgi:GH35 family endo-1,4-beta-xylanase
MDKGNNMQTKYVHRLITKLLSIILLLTVPNSLQPTSASSSVLYSPTPLPAEIQESFTLYGRVTDQTANPVQTNIYVTDLNNNTLANLLTNENGDYSIAFPERVNLVVNAFPQGLPQNLITLPDGYQISKYFELTKGVMPASASEEVNFVIPPAAVLRLAAYDPAGSLMNFDQVNQVLNPIEYYGYSGVYGVFPISTMPLPVPSEPSIGMFRWASSPDNDRTKWVPCFSVPPGEAIYLMALWEVPGIGTFALRADNQGLGYNLGEGEALEINLVYEFAETEYRRAQELKTRLEGEGHQFTSDLLAILSQADAALLQARALSDPPGRAISSYEVLRLSIQAKEQMTMEAAEADIPTRQEQIKVVVQDQAGTPIPGAAVTYRQEKLDFVITYGQGPPPAPYSSFRAGIDTGYQSLQGSVVWSQVSPQEGVFDFSVTDAMFQQWQEMGYDVVANLGWLNPDNVPVWAQNLDLADFQQQMGLFVKKAVEHYTGTIKYMFVATEINLHTTTGSRYVTVARPSDYLTGMQPADLIELIRTAFQAGREAHSDMWLGYYGISDYGFNILNPQPWGSWPPSYAFLKTVLDAGIQPDFIGVELFPGTLNIPQDLSNVAETLKAYHDLSGLPVMVAESLAYSSRAEDYSQIGPTPHIYWHEGLTQAAQSEWETSFFKIAMSQPYVLGVNMFRQFPDIIQHDPEIPLGDCMGVMECIGNGTDSLTQDFQPKQVYYAMQDLISSWKTNGVGVTDAQSEVRFDGLSGTYSIGITTPNGLYQSFERQINQASSVVTLTLDSPQAILDIQQRLAQAQKEVDWSAQLGRLFDYSLLRSQLTAARTALSGGDYASARSLIDQVLVVVTITIDGNQADWQGITPILTLPQGGVLVDAPGIDLKALYGMRDDEYLYLLVEVYDPPITLLPGEDSAGSRFPAFAFDLYNADGDKYAFRATLPYRGQIDLFYADPFHFIGTYYSIAYNNALELKIPLAVIDNPSQLSVWGFVWALENGEGVVAKAFDDIAEVLHPVPAIYLPLVMHGQ